MNRILPVLIILTSLLIMVTGYLLIPQDAHPEALLGAGIGLAFVIALAAILFRKGLIVPILIFVVMALAACGSDPLGLVAREEVRSAAQVQTAQIQADAQTDQARISASTARVRVGGWLVGAVIFGIAVVGVAAIAGMTHIQAQRDRLTYTPTQWRASLPAQPAAAAVTDGRRPGAKPMPLLRLTRGYRAPAPTLALPERSSTHDVRVIDA